MQLPPQQFLSSYPSAIEYGSQLGLTPVGGGDLGGYPQQLQSQSYPPHDVMQVRVTCLNRGTSGD
jgi:hypothetical protein